jgi:peptidoglycan/xylan/chitin deacetylase (PgdA/CDA1 family)
MNLAKVKRIDSKSTVQFMKRRLRLVYAGIALLICCGATWHFAKFHKGPIENAFNPIWWYRHVRGQDLYDPEYAILFHGDPKLNEVAITVDDGPHPEYGDKILDVLEKYKVHATFFVVGIKVKQDPEFVRRAVADGDEIGNHTYDHQRLPILSPHDIINEMRFNDMDIYKAAGIHPTIMRPPGDQYNDKVSLILKGLGYTDICWTDAAKDYVKETPEFIAERTLDRVEPGAIILLHQDYPGTAQALPVIIEGLEKQGYKMVTISEMLAHLKIEPYASQEKTKLAKAG